MNGDRALEKMRALHRSPEAHQARVDALLQRIKERLPEIEGLLREYGEHWAEEDGVYRFYHQSYKVFGRLQPLTQEGFALISRHLHLSRLSARLTAQGVNPLRSGVHPALQLAYPTSGCGAYPALWNSGQ
jgi:hypothetical protein